MPSQTPAALVTEAIAAWNAGDLDRIMADFAADAVLTRLPLAPGGGAWVGAAAIRAWIAPLLPGFRADVGELRADGNVVTVVETVAYDRLRESGIESIPVTFQTVVDDGKVVFMTVILTPETAALLDRAPAP